jgi:hypothetical protein
MFLTPTSSYNLQTEKEEVLTHLNLKIFFYINLSCLLVYALGLCLLLSLRKCAKFDCKTWGNISLYLVSFSMKLITWTYILSKYDVLKEKDIGEQKYETELWNQQSRWFLIDYFAVFMIKMSIYVFIFEIQHMYEYLSSADMEDFVKKRLFRKRMTYVVFSVHIVAIIIIESINYIDIRVDNLYLKKGGWGIFYLTVKIIVMVIDIAMIIAFWVTIRGFQQCRINSRLKFADMENFRSTVPSAGNYRD